MRTKSGSLARMLHILMLFDEARPVWSAAALIEALETSRATGYRYIKTLHDAGLLTTVRNGYYSLGPRIIEMDLQIRWQTHCCWPAKVSFRSWWTRSDTRRSCSPDVTMCPSSALRSAAPRLARLTVGAVANGVLRFRAPGRR